VAFGAALDANGGVKGCTSADASGRMIRRRPSGRSVPGLSEASDGAGRYFRAVVFDTFLARVIVSMFGLSGGDRCRVVMQRPVLSWSLGETARSWSIAAVGSDPKGAVDFAGRVMCGHCVASFTAIIVTPAAWACWHGSVGAERSRRGRRGCRDEVAFLNPGAGHRTGYRSTVQSGIPGGEMLATQTLIPHDDGGVGCAAAWIAYV